MEEKAYDAILVFGHCPYIDTGVAFVGIDVEPVFALHDFKFKSGLEAGYGFDVAGGEGLLGGVSVFG